MTESTSAAGIQVGPISLAAGVRRMHFWTYLYAAFICIAMLSGMNFLQIYLLDVHLQIPRSEQGALTGFLAFCTEVVALVLIVPFGVLADRIGRRPVVVFGLLVCGLGYALFPFATSAAQLIAFRILFAVGSAALAALIAVVGNDYTRERSRGRLFGVTGLMNGLGVIFMSAGLAQIPAVLAGRGFEPVAAGKGMFLTAAALCIGSALVLRFGLRPGVPVRVPVRASAAQSLTSGLRAARNPRIVLSYLAAFAGRADNAVKALFLSAWVVQIAPAAGIAAPAAMAHGGRLMALMGVVTLLWVPAFGYLLDRLNRVSGMALAMGLAAAGYLSMGLITSPFDSAMLPAFVLLAMGQGSAIVASVTLVGQEAAPAERGAIIATNGWFGAVGILVASLLGGVLFDALDPSAPFVLIGAFQFFVLLYALYVRARAPGSSDGKD